MTGEPDSRPYILQIGQEITEEDRENITIALINMLASEEWHAAAEREFAAAEAEEDRP